ncbi:MAG: metallophosphoesterase [Spirochaetaceae bacterium]|jgi:predicted phosphodiesterase|nr:metallophosphoesterase [Spirochaetaceae bacterium]
MVRGRISLPPTALLALFFLFLLGEGCSLPRYYNDYDSRFAWRDEFHLLSPADLSPVLDEEYSFLVVSDPHISDRSSMEGFEKLRDHIAGAQFVVVTGDVTQNGSIPELQLFMAAARKLGVPCYPVIGNHDIYTNRGTPWREYIGSTIYRIDSSSGNTTLFLLDNANASFGNDQLEWLEAGMRTAKKNTFVFCHDNFFMEASPPDVEQITDIRERARIMALLRGRCDMLFMGHLHKRIIREYGGLTYMVLEDYSSTKTWCRVRVTKGGISWEFETL